MLSVLSVIGYIFAVIGYILLALILLLCWIIIVPRSIYIEYCQEKGLTVKIRVFIFKISLYPNKFFEKLMGLSEKEPQEGTEPLQDEKIKDTATETSKEEAAATGQKQAQGQEEQERQPLQFSVPSSEAATPKQAKGKKEKAQKDYLKDLPQGLELIKECLTAVKGVFKILLRGIKFKDVCFTLPLQGQDAYETQQLYGKVTNAFYIFNTFLQRYVRIYYKNPVFIADFADNYKNSAYFYCKIQASPSIIIAVGWYLFKTYRKLIKNGTNKPDKQNKEI